MYRKGDIVVRLTAPIEGTFRKGTRAIVNEVLNDKEFTLEGHEGTYLQSSFRMDSIGNPTNPTVSDLGSLEQALRVIDNWNRTHPTGLMVHIEAYPAQDGGSLFRTDAFDTNDISQLMGHLINYSSAEEKAAALERAAQALRFGA
ncbi:hypothetical protein CHOED_021 [Vibrio phage CHOED]|uniref:hypothetical protein n=1 Tax=Vibrio phage CHOED TaxID=1458716 RepID=UPI00042F384D|nr:hypothetical protein CHOED_021 [Vibrio phage CHOED]AHK11881.1 hypothetical protein CHOED_021 [Vibrio phage CHOED]